MEAAVLVCERGESTSACVLLFVLCRLVANGAASSRASADTDEVVADRRRTCFLYTDTVVLFIARRVVASRREVQSEFWGPQPDLRQRIH
jgi:hypothetical protein